MWKNRSEQQLGNLGNRRVQCVHWRDGYETADCKVKMRLWHEKKWKREFDIQMMKYKQGKVGFKKNDWFLIQTIHILLVYNHTLVNVFSLARFLFHKWKVPLSWKQEEKCLEICAHFPALLWRFSVPFSQPLVQIFSNKIVLPRPWLRWCV